MGGNVVNYYPATMTADIQPNPNDVRTNLDTDGNVFEPWPVLKNVPIAWPRFGGFVLVGPLKQYDPVTLEAFDLDPTTWLAQGRSTKPVAPNDVRRLSGNYWSATPTDLTGPIKDASEAAAAFLLGLDGDTAQILFAAAALTLGKTGAQVTIAGGANTLAVGPWATGLASALGAFAMTVSTATTATQIAGAATTLLQALGLLPPPTTTATKAT